MNKDRIEVLKTYKNGAYDFSKLKLEKATEWQLEYLESIWNDMAEAHNKHLMVYKNIKKDLK